MNSSPIYGKIGAEFYKRYKTLLTNMPPAFIINNALFGKTYGSLAQLGEHLPYKQGVTGSSPVVPTTIWPGSSVG